MSEPEVHHVKSREHEQEEPVSGKPFCNACVLQVLAGQRTKQAGTVHAESEGALERGASSKSACKSAFSTSCCPLGVAPFPRAMHACDHCGTIRPHLAAFRAEKARNPACQG